MTSPSFQARLRAAIPDGSDAPTLPSRASLAAASASLPRRLPSHNTDVNTGTNAKGEEKDNDGAYLAPLGTEATLAHILTDIVPALNGQARSGRYYGFVTGGTLPVAEAADNIVSALDQNVQVHLPEQTVATEVESVALGMLADVLGLEDGSGGSGSEEVWKGKTFTTGATASNILGLACGREYVIAKRGGNVGEQGLLGACVSAGVKGVRVLTSMGHSSLSKAASVVGIGRANVVELPFSEDEPWRLDLEGVERALQAGEEDGVASIIAVSAGEVNTGRFATGGKGEMGRLKGLADRFGAWIHVDGAFGIFARALEAKPEFAKIREMASGLELADSITVDGHKLLNVPYDCGMFFCRSLATQTAIFTNPNAAYLSSAGASAIPSPLNIGLENSRRFRALPAYAVLRSEGRSGLAAILGRMVVLARKLAAWIRASEAYELLPEGAWDIEEMTHMVVLFRARDEVLNGELVGRINGTREVYVSGTSWKGRKAVRVAVGSWRVDVERDFEVVTRVLGDIAKTWARE
ncbi:pyridoxal-dependent decarboxylase [Colletotrichum scovillei]|uniref:Pyridoxal-dependent decarboxylase n=1 Tax=Colletotrichum scovillei TaxID=1209932 RepID=A0A9P7RE44_9PEZI|nr:pyridoxal-dependent decarboxylase [Colletotrichum scovillei]KAF4784933.1 pyridoxal-dependent decarboxylase [Colletotrichum scovillei]KAG7054973.1 pyridoxal-dependent decarboxylase [Colletotrichum scovillei]KAG7074418.1 pyridoxal-dependent decarboxylase [Colletotrichum scovillei]KAG7081030.1 pyridoxal-dependent decarboxylase [Colletotrichum scovillei]